MQSDHHVVRWRRRKLGLEAANAVVMTLPQSGSMSNAEAARWLRAMEATLRVAYDVAGQIDIKET